MKVFFYKTCMLACWQTVKKQVTALEERNRAVSEICAKHEQSLIILKDQAMEAQSKLARAEVQRENLQQEVLLLKTAEARLTKEGEVMPANCRLIITEGKIRIVEVV